MALKGKSMRIKDTWVVKTMDRITEAVCYCSQFIGEVLLQFAISLMKRLAYIALAATSVIWVIPYIILKRVVENHQRGNL